MRLAAVLHIGIGILLWVASSLSLAENRFSYIYYGGRWQSATIPWYYNPAQQPASYTTAQAVATLQASMASWSKGCGVRFSYQGLTSIPATQTGRTDRVAVLGWDPATSIPYTNFNYDANGLMTNGRIVFKPDPAPALSDFQANANHELGHLLGLTHSDQPRSIMFSNPYHAFDYQLTPKGDDYAACVALYGGGSLQDDGDLSRATVQANPAYQVDLYVSTSAPGNTPPASVSSIPASFMGTAYFSAYYRNVPVGRKLTLRTITPDGYEYEQVPFPNNFTTSYFYMYWSWDDGFAIQRLAGNWKLQLLDEGVLVAEKSFSIETDYVTPKVPLLGATVTAGGAGSLSLLAAPLQAGATEKSAFWTLDQVFVANALAGGNITPSAGAHTLTVDVNSGNSRYDGSVGHGANAQDDGPDNALRMNNVTNTAPTRAAFSANASGTRAALTLDGQIQIAATGKQQIYVAMLSGNSLLFQTANGWSSTPQPLMEANGPGWAVMNILKREDVRNLPSGASFYLGYGTSLDDLLAKGSYGLAYTLP